MSEEELYEGLKYLYSTVLKRKDRLTTHSGRKTGYLWNSIRGADTAQLMTAAHHEVHEVAVRYAKDCDAIKEVHKVFNDPNQALGNFRSCYCAAQETAADSASPGAKYQRPLRDIIVGFMEKRVGVDPIDQKARQPRYVMDTILYWEKPTNPFDTLKSHLADVSTDKTESILSCVFSLQGEAVQRAQVDANKKVEERSQQRFEALIGEFRGSLSCHVSGALLNEFDAFIKSKKSLSQVELPRPHSRQPFPREQKSKNRRGTKTLPSRKGMKTWPIKERLQFVLDNYDHDSGEYCNADRVFLLRVTKLYMCLTTCCNSDVDKFVELHVDPAKAYAFKSFKACAGCSEKLDENPNSI